MRAERGNQDRLYLPQFSPEIMVSSLAASVPSEDAPINVLGGLSIEVFARPLPEDKLHTSARLRYCLLIAVAVGVRWKLR